MVDPKDALVSVSYALDQGSVTRPGGRPGGSSGAARVVADRRFSHAGTGVARQACVRRHAALHADLLTTEPNTHQVGHIAHVAGHQLQPAVTIVAPENADLTYPK